MNVIVPGGMGHFEIYECRNLITTTVLKLSRLVIFALRMHLYNLSTVEKSNACKVLTRDPQFAANSLSLK